LALGTAVVVGLAPIYQLPGDYYEMGSIVVTRLLTVVSGGGPIAFEKVRSDDVFRLIEKMFTGPRELGFDSTGRFIAALALMLASMAMAVLLALLTYAWGRWFGRLFVSAGAEPTVKVRQS
jgi:hypothetical protein